MLSGMNSLEMIEENTNAATFAKVNMLSQEDLAFIEDIKNDIKGSMKSDVPAAGIVCLVIKEWIFRAFFPLITAVIMTVNLQD